jgi:DNA-binding MarR family transcriptional regulator
MEKYEQLLVSLRQVIRAIGIHSKQLNKKSGLTGPQLMVMKQIDQLDGPMAKQVAKEINLSPATVTSIIDRLEAKELVVRRRSQSDKRKVELYLSSTGETLLQGAPQPLQEHFIKRYQALQPWEQSQLLTSVERIASMMDAEELDAAPVLMVGQIQEEP